MSLLQLMGCKFVWWTCVCSKKYPKAVLFTTILSSIVILGILRYVIVNSSIFEYVIHAVFKVPWHPRTLSKKCFIKYLSSFNHIVYALKDHLLLGCVEWSWVVTILNAQHCAVSLMSLVYSIIFTSSCNV